MEFYEKLWDNRQDEKSHREREYTWVLSVHLSTGMRHLTGL